jgi:osmotically-inducible protein OsmY
MMALKWRRTPRDSSRDRHLAATVQFVLLKHPDLRVVDPAVESKAAVLLLRGRVPTVRQKHLAGAVAASVRGVAGVFNQLRVVKARQP